ncbi:uncharacterized protein B0T15DRAFT_401440, partial [Chaetomium strumarium]
LLWAQLVCRRWRDVIQDSPALQEACWYQYLGEKLPDGIGQHPAAWRLNPVFNLLGVTIGSDQPGLSPEHGDFDLTKRVHDKPESWTTMHATQPPCQLMEIQCYGDHSGDETMYSIIQSTTGRLLLGDVMAVLAECQNRMECGVDRWAGVVHYRGRLFPTTERDYVQDENYLSILQAMADDVSIKVVVGQAWGSGEFHAFSLRRLHPPVKRVACDAHVPASYVNILYELVAHDMVWGGVEYKWDVAGHGPLRERHRVGKTEAYHANLLAARGHEGDGNT